MGHRAEARRILPTPTGAKRLSNRKRVIRRRRQGRVTTVVFFTAAQPGPIVPVRAVDNQATNACPPDADAVTGDGIARSSGGHAE